MGENSKRAAHREMIESYRRWFAEGDRTVLLNALQLCLEENYRLPDWVRDGFLAAYAAVNNGTVNSWDKVFGPAKARSKAGRQWHLAHQVLTEVVHAQHEGKPIDQGLFESIGEKLDVSGSTARDHYYKRIPRRARQHKRTSKKSR